MTTCKEPKCGRFPMRGSDLCMSCSTRRDAFGLVLVLGLGTAILIGFYHFFGTRAP